jgi:hypothetical protein
MFASVSRRTECLLLNRYRCIGRRCWNEQNIGNSQKHSLQRQGLVVNGQAAMLELQSALEMAVGRR